MPRTLVRDTGTALNFGVGGASTNAVNFTASANMAAGVLTAYTWAAWVKIRTLGGASAGRIHDAAPFTILTTTPALAGVKIRVQISHTVTTPTTDSTDLPFNKWMRVLYTWDDTGTIPILYINGVANQLSTTAKSGVRSATLSAQYIGNRSALDRGFDGELDEVAIWNRVLTAQEIQNDALMYPPPTNGLISYKRFDEGSGTTAVDDVTTALNGTVSGATYITDKIGAARVAAPTRRATRNVPATLLMPGNDVDTQINVPTPSGTDFRPVGLASDFTVGGWVYLNYKNLGNNVDRHCLFVANYSFASDLGYLFQIDSKLGALSFYSGNTNVNSLNGFVPYNEWTYIIFELTGSTVNGYVNNALMWSTSITRKADSGLSYKFGYENGGAGTSKRRILGSLSDVFTYHGILTAAQKNTLMSGGVIPGLDVRYALNEGVGSVALDSSGNGNNGTITNPTYSLNSPAKNRLAISDNLIYNGNFEYAPLTNVPQTASAKFIDGTASGSSLPNPIGWLGSPDATASIQFDNTVVDTGNYALRLISPAGKNVELHKNSGYYSNRQLGDPGDVIKCYPNTQYTATIRLRVDAASGDSADGLWLAIYQALGDGTAGSIANTPKTKVVTAGWITQTVTFTTGATIAYLHPLVRLIGSTGAGTLAMTASVDNVTLTTNTTRMVVT